ncbi:hypothetical protein ACHAXA_006944 [Cyclostephanos tholiformis]|uniref:Uncharacterized protein n=1 Tax=Cyclostephanos tholiformis TaxID=382380 RepID=A0ABD3R1E6_9STRA
MAILYDPTYAKPYARRCTAYERIENTELALQDAWMAYRLEPSNVASRKNVDRLIKIEERRMEKLKEETIGKLVIIVVFAHPLPSLLIRRRHHRRHHLLPGRDFHLP